MLPWENSKFRSSKIAGNGPKTLILLILSLSVVHTAKIGSARTKSRQILPYSADCLTNLTTSDITRLIDEKVASFHGAGMGGILRSIFTRYVLLASQNPYPIIYSQSFGQ